MLGAFKQGASSTAICLPAYGRPKAMPDEFHEPRKGGNGEGLGCGKAGWWETEGAAGGENNVREKHGGIAREP